MHTALVLVIEISRALFIINIFVKVVFNFTTPQNTKEAVNKFTDISSLPQGSWTEAKGRKWGWDLDNNKTLYMLEWEDFNLWQVNTLRLSDRSLTTLHCDSTTSHSKALSVDDSSEILLGQITKK